jgi:flagellar motor switch/type III secretory pathway protein FliN
VRRRLASLFTEEALIRAIGEVLSAEVRLRILREEPSHASPDLDRTVFLETADGATSFWIEPEPALSTLLLARVLGRRDAITVPDARLEANTRGALAAVLVEVARRSGGTMPLRARHDPPPAATRACVAATLIVDSKPYRVAGWASDEELPTGGSEPTPNLASLGGLLVRLPLVVAVSVAAASELHGLRSGDVWLPGQGWLSHSTESGANVSFARGVLARAAVSPADAERGVEVGCSDDGQLVLRGNIIALGIDAGDGPAGRGGDKQTMSGTEETLTSLALDAPIVVRVEVGSVTLTARDWASLRPGDVLETGLRLSEPAVLRVAGREVARGELVSIDGELGVRIHEIIEGERPG